MGTSRNYSSGASKYGSSSGYGGSGSSYLNTSYGTPRSSSYRQSSYEPRNYNYGGSSVMERVKHLNPEPKSSSGSYTPLSSRRGTSATRDYSGGGNSWDKYSSRSGGSDYSANRSGYMSDYGGSNPSLYNSWDRTSSRSGKSYGARSRETSPVSIRPPPSRQYDYSSSASPSPYSTYRSSSDARSPSVSRRFERQNSRPEVYEESPRPRRKWETDVYGGAPKKREPLRETLPEPVKPPPNDYSDSDDSAPEDEKGQPLRYMTNRGTSPMPDPRKRDNRRSKEISPSAISKVKRVKVVHKEPRGGRNSRSDLRRKRLVDCATQTNLDDPPPSRRNRKQGGDGGGEVRQSRDDIAKMAALALLKDDNNDMSDTFYKYKDKFNQSPLSPTYQQQGRQQQQGTKFNYDSPSPRPSKQPEEKSSWRRAVYDESPPRASRNETPSKRDSRTSEVQEAPDEKSWRKAVYGEPEPAPLSRLRRHTTEEDLRMAMENPQRRRNPKTSTPSAHLSPPPMDRYDSEEEIRRPSPRSERRSYNESGSEKRRSQQSENESRRSQNNPDDYRRSTSRDSILDDKPNRRRQRTSSREILDDQDSAPSRTTLSPDSLSLRDSIDKVQIWKETLPSPQPAKHLAVKEIQRHPETGFPQSDSGEYFSAHEQHHPVSSLAYEPEVQYKDRMYAQQSPTSPHYHDDEREEMFSPGGSRRERVRRHLSREMSEEGVFDEERTHHPINKEKLRKSELNRNIENERKELEDLERRRRIYQGEDPEEVERIIQQQRKSGSSSDVFSRDVSPNRRRGKSYTSRQGSREDVLDEKRTRKEKRDSDPHISDSSQFGFNREGSPNRGGSRSKRSSRQGSHDDILDSKEKQYQQQQKHQQQQHNKYMRPHSMAVSNESLAQMSAASSIPSMHSAIADDGTIQNSASMQSIVSNETQEHPTDDRLYRQSMESSGGSLPDIVPGEEGAREQLSNRNRNKSPRPLRTKSGYIGGTNDIDNLLNFSPNEEEFVEKGTVVDDNLKKKRNGHILDAPVPRQPSPLRPQVSEEKLIDLDEPVNKISPLARTTSPLPKKAIGEEISPTGKEMWTLLKAKKGLVVIGDILELCEKPKTPRFIRIPGKVDEEKSFRGYETANEMLDNLQVDTQKLEDCALQIYRYHNGSAGDYGTYLDLESSLDEQSEELEGFQDQRKNALILRTQLTVRVHAVIEKLLNSSGRELRRALFSLKQIFQDDKDLVHEFVNNDGLDCLIKVGAEADQNYQNYILRALGQVMLYVDGMNGVINHNATIQWLYSLLASKIKSVDQISEILTFTEDDPRDLGLMKITKFRLVVKTALKLLLVFVEYTETNCHLLVKAIQSVDKKRMVKPWSNIMTILDEKDGGDSELLVYAMTLVNKVLNGVPDQDTFYDVVDSLEELGMERITARHMNRKGADLDLLTQFQVFEAALKAEDGEDEDIGQLENLRRTPRIKAEGDVRKSRRFSTGVAPGKNSQQGGMNKQNSAPFLDRLGEACPAEEYSKMRIRLNERSALPPAEHEQVDQMPDRRRRSNFLSTDENDQYVNGTGKGPSEETNVEVVNTDIQSVGDTIRSRRDRRSRQRDFIKAQEVGVGLQNGNRMSIASTSSTSTCSSNGSAPAPVALQDSKNSSLSSLSDTDSLDNQQNRMGREPPDKHLQRQHEESGYQSTDDHSRLYGDESQNFSEQNGDTKGLSNNQRWLLYKQSHKDQEEQNDTQANNAINEQSRMDECLNQRKENLNNDLNQNSTNTSNNKFESDNNKVKSELERFTSRNTEDEGPKKRSGPAGDKSGLISQAMENLHKKNEPSKPEPVIQKPDVKLTESDLQWERLQKRFHRTLKINDMDFTDLKLDDDDDVFAPPKLDFGSSGVPGAPPAPGAPPPPPPPGMAPPPPPPPGGMPPPPPPPGMGGQAFQSPNINVNLPPPPGANLKKTKKTLKLHWKIVQPEMPHPSTKGETIWKNIVSVKLDPAKLEHLFETRVSDIKQKRQEQSGKKQIVVLDPKRSNAINIGLTVLPPPRTIKTAILKMDNSIMNKEGIEKILTSMIPTDEEKAKILEAQLANPDIPLGTAEQFLITLSSISELQARLNVWLFKLEYETVESEVAEPLMDLKKGIEELLVNMTFKYILSTTLCIGNFLNGAQVRGFSIDYLSRVPEVKDTVHKHSLLHHLCSIIIEQFPDSTDFYSDIGPITRCSRVDWDELERKLNKLEDDCKASWDNLRAIVKHDGSSNSQLKSKMSEFLADAAERIMILQIVHKRVINRYHKLLLYMGLPLHLAKDQKVNYFCKTICEFALEYRTTREKVVQQMEKKASQRERKKTRGKMIVDMGKFKGSKGGSGSRSQEDQGEDELQRVLANGYTSADDRGLPGRQGRRRMGPADNRKSSMSGSRGCLTTDSEMYDTGDDEILEACVRTATTPSTRAPRERKRARNSRKSLRRTLKNGLSSDEVNAVVSRSEQV